MMTERQPGMFFSVSDAENLVDEHSELWAHYLPANRHPGDTENSQATLGDYFTAAGRFLASGDFSPVRTAAEVILGESVRTGDIETIGICLVKHGTFYHPARVHVVCTDGRSFDLALNLAVSSEGIACIERECDALGRLSGRCDAIPEVYGKGALTLNGDVETAMFAARWFDDYHEFHLTRENGRQKIVVWDDSKPPDFLPEEEEEVLYEEAAFIMTCCYNPLTCEQIQPWHHAAGDFVVHKDNGRLELKLITVRQYTSFFEEPPDDEETIVDALLIFLVNLSIRMRLDREDGIGDTLWAGESAVAGTVNGFWRGLAFLCAQNVMDRSIFKSFRNATDVVTREELMDVAMLLIGSYHPQSPDLSVIKENLENHIGQLDRELKKG